MEEKNINERESLEIIAAMIERTKERYMLGDGNILLMWGYLTIAVAVLVWVLLAITHNGLVNWLWYLIPAIGGIVTVWMLRRQRMEKGSKSYADGIVSGIWLTAGICGIICSLFCIIFFMMNIVAWNMMFVLGLVIIPFAEIAQGIIICEKSFVWGGAIGLMAGIFTLGCVAGGIALSASWYMPIFIAAFVCMMVIPGHVINHKAKMAK